MEDRSYYIGIHSVADLPLCKEVAGYDDLIVVEKKTRYHVLDVNGCIIGYVLVLTC